MTLLELLIKKYKLILIVVPTERLNKEVRLTNYLPAPRGRELVIKQRELAAQDRLTSNLE